MVANSKLSYGSAVFPLNQGCGCIPNLSVESLFENHLFLADGKAFEPLF
jgi:hypothetical protein